MIKKDNFGREQEYDSLLEYCSCERVFAIEKQEDGTFEVFDKCDEAFGVTLTSLELVELGGEIIKLAFK